MSASLSTDELLIEKLQAHLRAEGYSLRIQRWYPARVRQLLDYCNRNGLSIEAVRSAHVTRFLRGQYRLSRKRYSKLPPFQRWRHRYTGAINMMLRLVHGTWPVSDPPCTALEVFHRDIVKDYDAWLRDLRGLHPLTRAKRTKHALQFLTSLGQRADKQGLADLSVCDLDAYLKQCCDGLRRSSIEDRTVCLRDFLRHLSRTGCTAVDLASAVIGPHIYEHEDIPVALRTEEVQRVLEVTRKDLSPVGLRDYAILILLSTYGLRAAEVVNLRLDDLDWRRDILRVRHSKTGTYSELPLLREPGEAVLRYVEKARPSSIHRELFLRIQAPHRPFKNGSTLNCVTSARLRAAGVTPQGRKGPHAFRHARAVSLLRSGVIVLLVRNLALASRNAACGKAFPVTPPCIPADLPSP
ncbi:Integrase/recombinase, RitA (plasmid) [Cupriavidus necator H850]|uniref:tyrosine-type recombinase/integrase n=1 Tax=Cupriavidus necator TaxID=106590 RepID=UPI00129DB994|nr:tyrosine-type recombinase/integrase [Cupriavidus necator]KAI3608557.1 Integrase/recombinase, RitA [Cupriavidus necator H850]